MLCGHLQRQRERERESEKVGGGRRDIRGKRCSLVAKGGVHGVEK
jgi:hypothetical protein